MMPIPSARESIGVHPAPLADDRGMVLGTVQLGMKYGIANLAGQPGLVEAVAIVTAAWEQGVRYYDTAQAYGVSEEVLGIALRQIGASKTARVISKLKGGTDASVICLMRQGVKSSLARLGLQQLWGLMLHDEQALDAWAGATGCAMEEMKRDGLAQHLGVSIYSVERAEQALRNDAITIIQVPANVFDRRLMRVDFFRRAALLGKTVFVRSVYLQGLALLPELGAARAVPHAAEAVGALRQHCRELGVPVQKFAIDYVRAGAPGARIVIGADNADQTRENCRWFEAAPLPGTAAAAWDEKWPIDHEDLVDPRRWPPAG